MHGSDLIGVGRLVELAKDEIAGSGKVVDDPAVLAVDHDSKKLPSFTDNQVAGGRVESSRENAAGKGLVHLNVAGGLGADVKTVLAKRVAFLVDDDGLGKVIRVLGKGKGLDPELGSGLRAGKGYSNDPGVGLEELEARQGKQGAAFLGGTFHGAMGAGPTGGGAAEGKGGVGGVDKGKEEVAMLDEDGLGLNALIGVEENAGTVGIEDEMYVVGLVVLEEGVGVEGAVFSYVLL